ncbi:hypothetical protein AAFC00_000778 [Neodothiora populina]
MAPSQDMTWSEHESQPSHPTDTDAHNQQVQGQLLQQIPQFDSSQVVSGSTSGAAANHSHADTTTSGAAAASTTATNSSARPHRDRPCDACRRRKTRCVKDEGREKCVLCNFHAQECTYLHEPVARNRKRKASTERARKAKLSTRANPGIEEYDEYHGQTILRKTLGLMNKHHAHYVGMTEPFSFPRFCLPVGSSLKNVQGGQVTIRKVGQETIFTIHEDQGTVGYDSEDSRRDAIQDIVGPHGPELVRLYFRVVHPSFPIVHKGVWLEKYDRSVREFTAASLGAMYLLASSYWAYSPILADVPKPDFTRLWHLAMESFDYTIFRPKLSSVQAGLLLAQYESTDGGVISNGSRGKLTAHLISIAHKVGLHLDPTNWDIPEWEVGLRRRLAWALYMQDKWVALVEGRPPLISDLNWCVGMCQLHDFPEIQEHDEEGSSEVEKGRTMFLQMVHLTQILSHLLDGVHNLRAHYAIQSAPDPLRKLLEVVQPLQIRLKDWYASMRETLRMDNATALKLSATGYLRLAYLALEISIHRRIICQACSVDIEPQLLQVCRTAARARFLSAIEFVDSLKAQHLTSFWYFSSTASMTLLISFGNLLLGSAVDPEERQFYLNKMKEFRWTLKLNGEAGAKFIKPALAAMIIDPDELCQKRMGEFWVGGSPATTGSGASYGFSPPAGLDSAAFGTTRLNTASVVQTPLTSWQGATPTYDNLVTPAMPDMTEYLNAYAWMPPTFDGDQNPQFHSGQ